MANNAHSHPDDVGGTRCIPTNIVTEVVKVAFPQFEEVEKIFRVFHPCEEIGGCHAKVASAVIYRVERSWHIQILFLVKVGFHDFDKRFHEFERAILFRKRIPLPLGPLDLDDLKPRVEVRHLHCSTSGEAEFPEVVRVKLTFKVIAKGIKRDEITVCRLPHLDTTEDIMEGDSE